MAVTKEQKEFCAHNLVAMIIEDLHSYFPNKSNDFLITDFSCSETYAMLFDFKTGLWAEGPTYVMNMYLKERGIIEKL